MQAMFGQDGMFMHAPAAMQTPDGKSAPAKRKRESNDTDDEGRHLHDVFLLNVSDDEV